MVQRMKEYPDPPGYKNTPLWGRQNGHTTQCDICNVKGNEGDRNPIKHGNWCHTQICWNCENDPEEAKNGLNAVDLHITRCNDCLEYRRAHQHDEEFVRAHTGNLKDPPAKPTSKKKGKKSRATSNKKQKKAASKKPPRYLDDVDSDIVDFVMLSDRSNASEEESLESPVSGSPQTRQLPPIGQYSTAPDATCSNGVSLTSTHAVKPLVRQPDQAARRKSNRVSLEHIVRAIIHDVYLTVDDFNQMASSRHPKALLDKLDGMVKGWYKWVPPVSPGVEECSSSNRDELERPSSEKRLWIAASASLQQLSNSDSDPASTNRPSPLSFQISYQHPPSYGYRGHARELYTPRPSMMTGQQQPSYPQYPQSSYSGSHGFNTLPPRSFDSPYSPNMPLTTQHQGFPPMQPHQMRGRPSMSDNQSYAHFRAERHLPTPRNFETGSWANRSYNNSFPYSSRGGMSTATSLFKALEAAPSHVASSPATNTSPFPSTGVLGQYPVSYERNHPGGESCN